MQLLRSVPEALSAQSHQGGPDHANLEAAYDLHEMRQVRAGMSAGSTGNGTEHSIGRKNLTTAEQIEKTEALVLQKNRNTMIRQQN